MLVISPHLDDAVLSCGALLAARPGGTVVTVFAGVPADAQQLTDWDAKSGFFSAGEAIAKRRLEDREALGLLGAQPLWLDFCDAQYGASPSVDRLREAIAGLLATHVPKTVLYPLGLWHSDHRLVHEATRAALETVPDTQAWLYEDSPYRGRRGVLQRRLAELGSQSLCATPVRLPAQNGYAKVKAQALRAYASQTRAFGGSHGWDDAGQPERFWTLEAEGVSEEPANAQKAMEATSA